MVAHASPTEDQVFLAVVHAADGVRFAVSSDSAAVLTHRLAEYVRSRAEHMLWPREAAHLRTLLADGDLTGAVECYFWHVGERWDREWLVDSRHPIREDHEPGDDRALGSTRVTFEEMRQWASS